MGGERGDFFARNGRKSEVPFLPATLPRDIIERNFHVAITVRLVSKRDRDRSLNAYAQKMRGEYNADVTHVQRRGRGAERAIFECALFEPLGWRTPCTVLTTRQHETLNAFACQSSSKLRDV